MGADGHVVILDADKYDSLYKDFTPSWYGYTIFGHRVYVAYYSDWPMYNCLVCDKWQCAKHEKDENERIEKTRIGEWEVWT